MVDHLHRDLPAGRLRKRPALCAVKRRPGRFVDFGLQGALQFFVGLIGAGEVGLADEEAFAVVIGVDEPAGDVVG